MNLHTERFTAAARTCSYQKQDILGRDVKSIKKTLKKNQEGVIHDITRSRSESSQHYHNINATVAEEALKREQDARKMQDKFSRLIEQKENNEELKAELRNALKWFHASNPRLDSRTHDRE